MREAVADLVERREMFLSLLGRGVLSRCYHKHASNTPHFFLVLWLSYDVRHTWYFQGTVLFSTHGLACLVAGR